jgi:hypothetical protein
MEHLSWSSNGVSMTGECSESLQSASFPQVSLRQVRIHMNSFRFQDVCPKMGNTPQNCHSTMGKMMKSFNFQDIIQSHKLQTVASW